MSLVVEPAGESTQETGQTVQDDKKKRKPFFEVAQDEAGMWHWVLWSPNGRHMATNAIEYDRRKDAIAAIANFVEGVKTATAIVQASN